jgi:hypothetical protein
MNATLGPFNKSDFGKQLISNAPDFWDVLRADQALAAELHDDVCWDQDLDPDTVEASTICSHTVLRNTSFVTYVQGSVPISKASSQRFVRTQFSVIRPLLHTCRAACQSVNLQHVCVVGDFVGALHTLALPRLTWANQEACGLISDMPKMLARRSSCMWLIVQ